MKKTWKLAFAAFAMFAFTACSNEDTTTATESENIETTEDVEMDLETEDTTVLEDTTVNDGITDGIQEEQPPVQ